MPYSVYTLDDAISSFFLGAGSSSSREQCDQYAYRSYGGHIEPVHIQGSNSYTVIAGPSGNKIVQFREQSAMLDTNTLALVRDIHGNVVPLCSELGRIGDVESSQLIVYEMDRLPGENFILARPSLTGTQRLNTVTSLTKFVDIRLASCLLDNLLTGDRFFAQSWQSGASRASLFVDRSVVEAECYARFNYLANVLPERFQHVVAEVHDALPMLLDGCYPMTPTHGDLNEMNILVDTCSGEITGIVDWADATILPFGFTLYALENVLGSMGPDGWKWFDNVDDLRNGFWTAFQERTGASEDELRLIRLAGKAGILIRYGTAFNSGFPGMIGVRDPNSEDLRYLDALLG